MRLGLLVTCLALAGCIGAPEPPGGPAAIRDDESCHDRTPLASGNAPFTSGFRGAHDEVLARLAAAVGANTTSAPVDAEDERLPRRTPAEYEVEHGRWTQWTDNGELRFERVAGHELFGPETYLSWTGNRTWSPTEAEARAWIEGLARAFGADPTTLAFDDPAQVGAGHFTFHQTLEGTRLGGTGGSLRAGIPGVVRPAIDLQGLRALPSEALAVNETEARAIAVPHARCVLDESGRTSEAGYATIGAEGFEQLEVHGDSIVRGILVRFAEPGEPSHCGMAILVRIDATTGSVLGAGRPPCD